MTYLGQVEKGVVIFRGAQRPPEGATVRVEEISAAEARTWGDVFKDLIGAAEGLPVDLAEKHDQHIHGAAER